MSAGSDNRLIVWEAQNDRVSYLCLKVVKAKNKQRKEKKNTYFHPLSSSSSQWSVEATQLLFPLWTGFMCTILRYWWPLQLLTPQSVCGFAVEGRKVSNIASQKIIDSIYLNIYFEHLLTSYCHETTYTQQMYIVSRKKITNKRKCWKMRGVKCDLV